VRVHAQRPGDTAFLLRPPLKTSATEGKIWTKLMPKCLVSERLPTCDGAGKTLADPACTVTPGQENLVLKWQLYRSDSHHCWASRSEKSRHGATAPSNSTKTTKVTAEEKRLSASSRARGCQIATAAVCLPGISDAHSGVFWGLKGAGF